METAIVCGACMRVTQGKTSGIDCWYAAQITTTQTTNMMIQADPNAAVGIAST